MFSGNKRGRAERRPDCKVCGGLGKYRDVVHHYDRRTKNKWKTKEWVDCPKCKGRGYR